MNNIIALLATIIGLATVMPTHILAQEARRAAVMTVKGDLVEGVLKSVTDTETVIEIAGQAVRIPTSEIKYISFVGKIEGGTSLTPPALNPMDKAFASLKDLRAATQVGMLRDQYAQKLVETLPNVSAFVDSEGDDWKDVRLALMSAIANYQRPLSSLEAWKGAGESMGRGGLYAEYAMKLAQEKLEAKHVEDPGPKQISIGDEQTGRLGFGDQQMTAKLDRSTEGALNDVYDLVVKEKQRVVIEMSCVPCIPHLTVALIGKSVEGDMGWNGTSTVKFDADPNRYQIWVGTQKGSVGAYKLRVSVAK